MPKKLYKFDLETREYLGAVTAQVDPLGSTQKKVVYFPQADAVNFAPSTAVKNGFVQVLNATGDAWSEVEDNRGVVYDTSTQAEQVYDALGALPANLTKKKPIPNSKWDATAKAWVFDVAKAVAERVSIINVECAKAIVGGFSSSALGAAHQYDSAMEDQLNLVGAANAGIDMPYTCTDSSGVKAEVLHTATQLKQVYMDGITYKAAQLTKARNLKASLEQLLSSSTATQADVDAIVW